MNPRLRGIGNLIGHSVRPKAFSVRPISTMHLLRKQNTDGTDIFKQAMRVQRQKDEKKPAQKPMNEKKAAQKQGEEKAQANTETNKEPNEDPNEDPKVKEEGNEEDKESKERIGWAFGLGALASYIYLGWGDDNREDENFFTAHNRRCWESLVESYEYFMNPPKKALLPPLPKREHRDFTICLELGDVLTHLDWDVELGWRVAIRPGLKEFLYNLRQYFEVVIFTDTPGQFAEPVIASFDQIGLVHYRLYREHHRLEGDVHLKDLEFLNRPVTNVVVLESNMKRLKTHPDNGMLIKTWTGEEDDNELKEWTKVLHEMMTLAVVEKQKDLRPLIAKVKEYDNENVPRAWELYKQARRDEELAKIPKSATPAQNQNGWLQTAMNETTKVLQTLAGGVGMTVKRPSHARALTTIDKLELGCAEIRKSISKEYKNFLELEKRYMKEQQDRMKKHVEELEQKDYKLIDYLMGTVPQIGEEPQK